MNQNAISSNKVSVVDCQFFNAPVTWTEQTFINFRNVSKRKIHLLVKIRRLNSSVIRFFSISGLLSDKSLGIWMKSAD